MATSTAWRLRLSSRMDLKQKKTSHSLTIHKLCQQAYIFSKAVAPTIPDIQKSDEREVTATRANLCPFRPAVFPLHRENCRRTPSTFTAVYWKHIFDLFTYLGNFFGPADLVSHFGSQSNRIFPIRASIHAFNTHERKNKKIKKKGNRDVYANTIFYISCCDFISPASINSLTNEHARLNQTLLYRPPRSAIFYNYLFSQL